MTLADWMEANEEAAVLSGRHETVINREDIAALGGNCALVFSHDPELWCLTDYLVTSSCGNHLVLVPREE